MPPSSQRISIAALGMCAFIVSADVRVVVPLLPAVAAEFGVEVGAAGVVVTTYAVAYGLFQLVFGPLGDRFGKLNVVAAALAGAGLAGASSALAPTLEGLAILRLLVGALAAGVIPLCLAAIGDNYQYGERQTALGRFLAFGASGTILSATIGGILGQFVSWRALFVLFGLMAIGLAGFVLREARRFPQPRSNRPIGVAALLPYVAIMRAPGAALVIGCVMLEGVFLFGAIPFWGGFLRERFDLPYAAIGLAVSAYGLGAIAQSRWSPWMIPRIRERGMVAGGAALAAVSLAIVPFAPAWPLALPPLFACGVAFTMLHSTLQTRATEFAAEARGASLAIFVFWFFLAQGLGAAIVGPLIDGPGYAAAFLFCGAGMGVLSALFALFARPSGARTPPSAASPA